VTFVPQPPTAATAPIWAIELDRVAASWRGPLPRYGDPIWLLTPLDDNPAGRAHRIVWDGYPVVLREEFRLLVWLLINRRLPDAFLAGRAPSWRSRPSYAGIYHTHLAWLRLAKWLARRGTTTLRACQADVFDTYFDDAIRPRGLDRTQVHNELAAFTRLWALDATSPRPAGVGEPPWAHDDDEYVPSARPGGENTTEPIAPATIGPLLVWSLRLVEDFAADILAATEAHQRLLARAAHANATPESRDRVESYLARLAADGQPLPTRTRTAGAPTLATTYISALTDATEHQVQRACQKSPWPAYLRNHPGTSPLPVEITARVDRQPWTDGIDFHDIADLRRHLATAAFVVIAYLTGMRPAEALSLPHGCCTPSADGPALLYARTFKTTTGTDGTHDPSGRRRETPWVAIPPVTDAVRVLESMAPSGSLLFDAAHHTQRRHHSRPKALTVEAMRERLAAYVDWINTVATRLGRPHERVAPDPHGPLTPRRLRRTLAWHIARLPGGLVALAVQYGHLRTALSAGYASRSRGGIHDLLDIETARATADTLARLHDDLATGAGISGPAAARAIRSASHGPAFAGVLHTSRQARELLANPSLAVHDNPHAYLLCVYDRDKALCHRTGPRPDAPRLDGCEPLCANIARTDQHARTLIAHAATLEHQADSSLTPPPLAARLRHQAQRHRDIAAQHHRDRTTQEATS
jgi:hypothetical protein